jgi:hypothetical protein
MFQTEFVEKIKARVLCSITLFSKNRAIYEVMRKNIVQQGQATDDNTIWHMRIACWIPKATNTHSEYAIHIAFPLQRREWSSV